MFLARFIRISLGVAVLTAASISYKIRDIWLLPEDEDNNITTPPQEYTDTPPHPIFLSSVGDVAKRELIDEEDTVFVTAGNYGFREFIQNAVKSVEAAYPTRRVLVVFFDEIGLDWCEKNLTRTSLKTSCAHQPCPCPYDDNKGLGTEGYTTCLLGIYICKLRVKEAVLRAGAKSMLFIDGDAAVRKNALELALPVEGGLDVVGACEMCAGSCHLSADVHKLVDFGAQSGVKTLNYNQINIGLVWLNGTAAVLTAVMQSIDLIVKHKLDFKSVDQTVFNRRLLSLPLRARCLPTHLGGLNVKSRSSRPKHFPDSWGVHAARLISRTGFYKKAFLHRNGLWHLPLSSEFIERYNRYQANPSGFKKYLKSIGEI